MAHRSVARRARRGQRPVRFTRRRRGRILCDLKGRAQHDDPTDCEAVDKDGQRIAIEVTELVDETAIKRTQAQRRELKDQDDRPPISEQWVDWDLVKFQKVVQERLVAKNSHFPHLKGAPYP
jgi:hypothetical protein